MAVATSTKPQKKGVLRTAFRRLFGKRTNKHMSLSTSTEQRQEQPQLFEIATSSPTQPNLSAPTNVVSRASALGSHAPSALPVSQPVFPDRGLPPRNDRSPPERPPRPRRVSLPSVILSTQDSKVIQQALNGLGLQDLHDEPQEICNIGFAVTSGSNPHRRSRSVGGYRDSMKEHRMSPIQWRQWRRRSDEIRYWRASVDQLQGPAVPPSPELGSKIPSDTMENERHLEAHNDDFDFDLDPEQPRRNHQSALSHEYSHIEERLITMELTMMRLELAISKVQAGSFSSVDRDTDRFEARTNAVMNHSRTESGSTDPGVPRTARPDKGTPASQQTAFGADSASHSRQRPTSIATTLKAFGPDLSAPSKVMSDHRSRQSSMTGLTIEHYTALTTLLRRERSARKRLEDQVSELSLQVQALYAQGRTSNPHPPRSSNEAYHVRSESRAEKFRFGGQARTGSEDYGGASDTDDASFHETYVTPIEREYSEGRAYGHEEGVAF